MEPVIELLGNYAFPIVMCLAMCYVVFDMNKKHEKECDNFAEAINNNTKVMEKILMVLDDIKNK